MPFSGLWSSKPYRWFIAGQSISLIGSWSQRVALDWIVLSISGSTVQLGYFVALQFSPILLLSTTLNRWFRRHEPGKLLIIVQFGFVSLSLALYAYVTTSRASFGGLAIFAVVFGVLAAVDNPMRQIFVGELAGPANRPAAIAFGASVFNVSRFVGPTLAATLMTWSSPAGACLANGVLTAASIPFLVAAVRRATPALPSPERHNDLAPDHGTSRSGLDRPRRLYLLASMVAIFGLQFQIVLLSVVRSDGAHGAGAYGVLSGMLGLGALAGSLLALGAGRNHTHARMQLSAVGMGAALVVMGCAHGPLLQGTVAAALGLASSLFYASANQLLQQIVNHDLRRRAVSRFLSLYMGLPPMLAPLVGWMFEALSLKFCLALLSLGIWLGAVMYQSSEGISLPLATRIQRINTSNVGKAVDVKD